METVDTLQSQNNRTFFKGIEFASYVYTITFLLYDRYKLSVSIECSKFRGKVTNALPPLHLNNGKI